MLSNRSKRMMALVQGRNLAPKKTTRDEQVKSVPPHKVTLLADIRNKAENQPYSNVRDYVEFSESASVSSENDLPRTLVVRDGCDNFEISDNRDALYKVAEGENLAPKTTTQDEELLTDIKNKAEKHPYSNVQANLEFSESASVDNENDLPRTLVVRDSCDNSEISDDQDPSYKVPKKKKKQALVYPSRQSTSSGSSSSSSSPSSSDSSSDSSDTDSEQNKEQANAIPETVEHQSEQTNIDEPVTTENSRNQVSTTTLQEEKIEGKKKGRKRKRNENSWKQSKVKSLRNSGKKYTTKKNKTVESRSVKPPCGDKCRLKCYDNITADQRQIIFEAYWKLGEVDAQRSFIMSCMTDINPRYKYLLTYYTNAMNPRKCNKAFHFIVQGKSVRVCKTFFMRTLDISDRVIRTVKDKTDENGILAKDLRGHHVNHVKVDEALVIDMKQFIDAIPRIESHYTRQTSTREFIDGGKTITDIYKDFKDAQERNNKSAGKYCSFYKVFTEQYNISFFRPRKDQCDFCLQYNNSTPEQKVSLQQSMDAHLEEKNLSRQEKFEDRCNIDEKNKVLVFDLQAVLQSPRGDTSGFYYKSKLNSYNFTVTFLNKKVEGQMKDSYEDVHCFFWNETDAKRGASEIGSCLLKIFEKISGESQDNNGYNLILYSDNCSGQNKNKFLVALYLYAVTHLNINSITHKYLIRGHTQNEGDNIHSLIEKEITKNLKSGPIYSPHQYVAIIKNAKKSGKKFSVHELTFESFLDLKKLQEDWGPNFNKAKDGSAVLWNDVKMFRVKKGAPFSFFVKTSYKDNEFQEVCIRNQRKKMLPVSAISLTNAYTGKQLLSANKKKDLQELLTKKLIPGFYSDYYNSIL